MTIGIVTGLTAERDLIERAIRRAGARSVDVRCDGPGATAAEGAARALVGKGASALASFGVAGGLRRGVLPGTVIVARHIMSADTKAERVIVETDAAWRRALLSRLLGADYVIDGDICCVAEPLATAADKAALNESIGAVAVDMESLAIAQVAAEAGLPFMAVRAITDPAERNLPATFLRATTPSGGVRMGATTISILIRPTIWPAAILLALDWRAARGALRGVLATVGPTLSLPVRIEKA